MWFSPVRTDNGKHDGEGEVEEMDLFLKELFRHATLQNISSMIRNGGMCRFESNNFIAREEKAQAELQKVLYKYIPESESEPIETAINTFNNVFIEIYFNLGMKIGAQLQVQLLTNPENDYL